MRPWREDRTALRTTGLLRIVAGFLFTPLLCGPGILLMMIGGVMWMRGD